MAVRALPGEAAPEAPAGGSGGAVAPHPRGEAPGAFSFHARKHILSQAKRVLRLPVVHQRA
eukprot:15437812-Alexandrium_andersonii.AAC.1